MKPKYYTAEVMEKNGDWHRSEIFIDTYKSKFQANFAIGRQEDYDEIGHNIRNYRVGIYDERRTQSYAGSFTNNSHRHHE